jgi:hypothetical protein
MRRATSSYTIPIAIMGKRAGNYGSKTGCRKMPLQRLALYAGKLARTVLGGLGVGNRVWLPNEAMRPA